MRARALLIAMGALSLILLSSIEAARAQSEPPSRVDGQGERALSVAERALGEFARSADDFSALFARLPPERRRPMLERARVIIAALDGAERALLKRLQGVESSPDFATSEALQSEAARLGVELLDVRLPAARAFARLIESALDPRAQESVPAAREELERLDFGDSPAEAWRRALLGAARWKSGDPAAASSLDAARRLAARFPNDSLARRADALAGLAQGALAARDGPEAGADALRDVDRLARAPDERLLLRAVAADIIFRGALDASAPLDIRLARGVEVHLALLADDSLGGSPAQRRALVFDRLRRWRGVAPESAWPPALKTAVAVDPELDSRRAARLAEEAVAGARAEVISREAMWIAARRRAEARDFLDSLRWCSAIVQGEDEPTRRREALALGRAAAARAASSSARDDALAALLRAGLDALEGARADAARVQLAALLEQGALEREMLLREVGANSRAYPAARALLGEDALAAGDPDSALARAEEALAGAAEDDPIRIGALRLRARALGELGRLHDAGEAAAALARADPGAGRAEAERLARALTGALRAARVRRDASRVESLADAGEILLSLADERSTPPDMPFAILRAETLLARAGDPSGASAAADAFGGLIERAGRRPWLLLGRADALRAGGEEEAAFAAHRELARALERAGEPAASAHADVYWSAWASIIEMLAERARGEPDRVVVIRRELSRLLAVDAELGGGTLRARFERAAGRAGVSIDALRF